MATSRTIPTVRVRNKEVEGGVMIINKSKYDADPKKYTLVREKVAASTKESVQEK